MQAADIFLGAILFLGLIVSIIIFYAKDKTNYFDDEGDDNGFWK